MRLVKEELKGIKESRVRQDLLDLMAKMALLEPRAEKDLLDLRAKKDLWVPQGFKEIGACKDLLDPMGKQGLEVKLVREDL